MKITKSKGPVEKIKMKTQATPEKEQLAEWWKAEDETQLALQVTAVASYLKQSQAYRLRQVATDVRMYCGLSISSYAGSNVSKMDKTKTLPDDRPTFNAIEACVDTLGSRLSQNKPSPKFLTDNADYKERHLAQELNGFVQGEFHQTHVYEKAPKMLRDCLATGTGVLKVGERDDKVVVDRIMSVDLYVDENDSINGEPQSIYQLMLCDRDKFMANHPKAKPIIQGTPQSYPDNAADATKTVADQIMVVEAWKLPSGSNPEDPHYIPGRHVIATVAGKILDEPWHKTKFPFVFMHYSAPFLGFWGRGIATRLFGSQVTLNRILYTISQAIQLTGVPRVFQEQGSSVVTTHHANLIGVIVKYKGVKPSYEVAPCNAPELYAERDKLIEHCFQQEGVSEMQATSRKPAGLNSGEAVRSYDDINSDRFAETSSKYDQVFVDLAYLITETAMDIAKRTGKYQTVYPMKDGTKEINLPAMKFLKNPFVIKCFTESALPRTPAGRIQTVTEMVQAGMLTLKEGRRLMKAPDLEQNEKLDNASEERIFQMLDRIVEKGEYTQPDIFLDLELATTLVVQYINLYKAAALEEEKADLLVTYFNQVQDIKLAGMPPQAGPAPGPTPQAVPEPPPTSPLIPNAPGMAA